MVETSPREASATTLPLAAEPLSLLDTNSARLCSDRFAFHYGKCNTKPGRRPGTVVPCDVPIIPKEDLPSDPRALWQWECSVRIQTEVAKREEASGRDDGQRVLQEVQRKEVNGLPADPRGEDPVDNTFGPLFHCG